MLKPITPQSADRIAILVIGPAGIGKTSLLRTLCGQYYDGESWKQWDNVQPAKVCVLSAESGLLCVRDLVVNGTIQGYEISSLSEFQEAQRLCMSKEFKDSGVKWIFIDSLTEIATRCAAQIKADYEAATGNSKQNGFKIWADYNTTMTDIIKSFRDLTDYNVVFTCLEKRDKDEGGNALGLSPDIPGTTLNNRLTSYFDEVFHMEKGRDGNGKDCIFFSTKSPLGLSKDRSGKLQPYEAPNLLSVQFKILN